MLLNVRDYLINKTDSTEKNVQLPDIQIDPQTIQCMMISEVPPLDPEDYFYSKNDEADYVKSTIHLFQSAGVEVMTIDELLNKGIYITTAVKTPKNEYTIPKSKILEHLSILEKEIDLFPHLKVIMLMGDVAKKSFNELIKRKGHKSVIPSGTTYKIREKAYYYGKIRVFPSYIMTGKNILIEKSKRQMIAEDIKEMMDILLQNEE